MNRFHAKPKLNPVCKLRQSLPTLPLILPASAQVGTKLPLLALDPKLGSAAPATQGGGLISLCKNFAFSNLF